MITNDEARVKVKLLKATRNISYCKFAKKCGLANGVIYNWLNNQFDFCADRLAIVERILSHFKEE